MEDYLVRVIAREAGVRGFACVTTHVVAEGARRHATPPAATIALGEALTGGILLGTLLKVGQRIAIKMVGNQSGRKILAEANNNGKVRGYVSLPDDDPLMKEGVELEGHFFEQDGFLTVIKDLRLRNLYESTVSLTGEGIVADFESYLNQSEQLPSVVKAGVILSENESESEGIVVAGGLLLQALPPYDKAVIDRLAGRTEEMPPIEVLLNSGKTPEDILSEVFVDIEYDILERIPLHFRCHCSRERSEKALISLGRDELINLFEVEGEAVVDCHFCFEKYHFDAFDLMQLIKGLDEADPT